MFEVKFFSLSKECERVENVFNLSLYENQHFISP